VTNTIGFILPPDLSEDETSEFDRTAVLGSELSTEGGAYLFTNIMPKATTLLSADPKIGKSWIGLNVAVCTALGLPLFGDPRFKPSGSGDVLYFAMEDLQAGTHDRLERMQVPQEARNRIRVYHQADGGPKKLDGSLERFIKIWITKVLNPKLIIIDVLADVRTERKGREIVQHDRDEIGIFNTIAAHNDLAVLLIHHNKKGKEDTALRQSSGSFGITGSVFAAWGLTKSAKGLLLEVSGRNVPPDELLLAQEPEGSFVYKVQSREAKLSSQQEEVLMAGIVIFNANSIITAKLLEEQLEYKIKCSQIRPVLARLMEKGTLRRSRNKGQYELVNDAPVVTQMQKKFRLEYGLSDLGTEGQVNV
jgi:hypothetical protein